MSTSGRRRTILCCLLALILAPGPAAEAADDDFIQLIDGEKPSQFDVVDLKGDAIQIQNGEIRLSGNTEGYFATKKEYGNYTLRFEWMYEKHGGKPSDGNSGLMLHMQGKPQPPKPWPKSIEVQIWYKEFGSFYALADGKFNPQHDDRGARDKALRPLGEWNRQEIVCQDGKIAVKVNDVEYARGEGAQPDHGRIGWMYEGAPIRFRELKIRAAK